MLENLSSPIATRLHELSDKGRLVLFACCCERLLPNYEAFCSQVTWGSPSLLRTALNLVWDVIFEDRNVDQTEIQRLVSSIYKVIPDADDFASPFTALAQNAAIALMHTLESIFENDNKKARTILELPLDSLDDYLHACTFPGANDYFYTSGFEEWVNSAPIVLREREIQIEDFNALKNETSIQIAQNCRDRSKNEGAQPFLRGLLKKTKPRYGWLKWFRKVSLP